MPVSCERCATTEVFFAWMRSEVERLNGLAKDIEKGAPAEHRLAGALVAHGFRDEAKALEAALDEAESRGLVAPRGLSP